MLFRSFWALALTGVIGATIGIRTAAAQTCGEQPQNLPIEVQQQIKGDAEGKAKLAVRLLGDASLSGSVDASCARSTTTSIAPPSTGTSSG
jgi:hypothetical protein